MTHNEPQPAAKSWLHQRKRSLLLVFLVVGAMGLALSAARIPPWYDDACHWLVARTLHHTGTTAFPLATDMTRIDPDSRFVTVGPAVNYLVAGWMWLFGDDFWRVRVLMSVIGLLMLLALFRLAVHGLHFAKAVWAVALLAGSVPFITFGSQLLGEGAMLLFLLTGLRALLASATMRWQDALVASVCFNLAILSKEYIALPVGLMLVFGFVRALLDDRKATVKWLVMGATLPLGVAVWYALKFDSWADLQAYWALKSAYTSEFLALTFSQSLRFLLFKPVIVLGTLALVLRVIFRREWQDGLLLVLQAQLLVFFLLSAGYDRFGLVLMPIACIYLGEWVYAVLLRMDTSLLHRKRLQQGAFILGVLLVSWQKWWLNPVLQYKRDLAIAIPTQAQSVFTYDLQFVPELYDQKRIDLPTFTPAEAEQGTCKQQMFTPTHPILIGPYANGAYKQCWTAAPDAILRAQTPEDRE
ncbi:MAG: ArnT family glycosyltransferase [Bacteroidota bacterium]